MNNQYSIAPYNPSLGYYGYGMGQTSDAPLSTTSKWVIGGLVVAALWGALASGGKYTSGRGF